MRLGAAHDHPASRLLLAALGHAQAGALAGRDEGRQVAEGSALHEDAARGRGQAELAGEPSEGLVLGEHGAGALEPRSAVERTRRHHEVERDGGLGRCRRDEGEVLRVIRRDARRGEHVLEQGERAGGADAVLVDRPAGEALELGGAERLVERSVRAQDAAAGVLEHHVDDVAGLLRDLVHAGGLGSGGRCRSACCVHGYILAFSRRLREYSWAQTSESDTARSVADWSGTFARVRVRRCRKSSRSGCCRTRWSGPRRSPRPTPLTSSLLLTEASSSS